MCGASLSSPGSSHGHGLLNTASQDFDMLSRGSDCYNARIINKGKQHRIRSQCDAIHRTLHSIVPEGSAMTGATMAAEPACLRRTSLRATAAPCRTCMAHDHSIEKWAAVSQSVALLLCNTLNYRTQVANACHQGSAWFMQC